jgi:CheY-like chemotaxis protein
MGLLTRYSCVRGAFSLSKWMLVEDEPDIYELLLAMFEMWGIAGEAFVDGEEALAWIEDADHGQLIGETPELALLDIRLPGAISGPMVGERLRKSPLLKNIGIVLITAYKLSVEEEKAVLAQAGADKLVYKPLPRFNELKKLLEDVIAERRSKLKVAVVSSEKPQDKK